MGQISGKVKNLKPGIQPFVNLPRQHKIVEAFDLLAEGYDVTLDEMNKIMDLSFKDRLGVEYDCTFFEENVKKLFQIFDCHNKGVVDYFEVLSTLCLVSDMCLEDKVNFVFDLYDLEKTTGLSEEGVVLAMRSAISGLCKITGYERPHQDSVDKLANLAFCPTSSASKDVIHTIGRKRFLENIKHLPDVCSWLEHFDDIDEAYLYKRKESKKILKKKEVHGNGEDPSFINTQVEDKVVQLNSDDGNWRQVAELSRPKDMVASGVADIPKSNLQLEWIYGRNTPKLSRNNSFYSLDTNGQRMIIYPAGSTCVKLCKDNDGSLSQKFYTGHRGYITCVANYRGLFVASSERIKNPLIKIWSCSSMKTLKTLKGFHQDGVEHLGFSPSGELLLSVGNSNPSCIVIYQWKQERILFTTTTSCSSAVMDCQFLGSESRFGTCGDSFVNFWEIDEFSSTYEHRKGLFGDVTQRQPMMCITHAAGNTITGGERGKIFMWEGRSCMKVFKTYSEATITSVYSIADDNKKGQSSPYALCAGSSDGNLFLFNESIELHISHSLRSYVSNDKHIDSLCYDHNANRILVGIRSSDLLEINNTNGSVDQVYTKGHHGKGLCGLDTSPVTEHLFVSAGADGLICVWDAQKYTTIQVRDLNTPLCCISYSHDGSRIAVGCGQEYEEGKYPEGTFVIVDSTELTTIFRGRHSKKALTASRHSNDGMYLAFSSKDTHIYIHNTTDYSLCARTSSQLSYVSDFDFGRKEECSQTSVIYSNTVNQEATFWNIQGKKQAPKSQRDIQLESFTCPYAWSMVGIHHNHERILACDRSKLGNEVAVSNSAGEIYLYTYPALSNECSINLKVYGHGGPISKLKYSNMDKWLFTAGQDDCCLMQWKCIYHDDKQAHHMIPKTDGKDGLNGTEAVFLKDKNIDMGVSSESWDVAIHESVEFASQFEESLSNGSPYEHIAIRPWQRAIVAPSNVSKSHNTSTTSQESSLSQTLSLKWVHGYNGSRRRNVRYGRDGQIIYPVGRTLIVYNHSKQEQLFFQGATDEIICIAIHPSRSICAIGQVGTSQIIIHCLDYRSMDTVQAIRSQHQRAVSHANFDSTGCYLVTLGNDIFNSIIIYSWECATVVASAQTSMSITKDIDFTKDGKMLQCGDGFLRVWAIDGNNLSYRDVKDESGHLNLKDISFHTILRNDSQPIVCAADGYLYKIDGDSNLDSIIKVSENRIISVDSSTEGILIASEDGMITIWDKSGKLKTCSFNLQDFGISGSCGSIEWKNEEDKILVGTNKGQIWEISSIDDSNVYPELIVKGHSGADDLVGVSASNDGTLVCTSGDDKMFHIWSTETNSLVRSCKLECPSRACTFSPDSSMIAVGHGSSTNNSSVAQNEGKWIVIDVATLSTIAQRKDSQRMISEIRWSPCGNHIAVGSHDFQVYVYNIHTSSSNSISVQLAVVIDENHSPITRIDFSEDSRYLQVNCLDYQLRFFERKTGSHIPNTSRVKNVQWYEPTCTLAYAVQGVWSPYNDEDRIECLDCFIDNDQYQSRSSIVAGDNFGRLRLLPYPCTSQFSKYKMFRSHCGRVAAVKWALESTKLVSVGRDDKAIMIWDVIKMNLPRQEGDSSSKVETLEEIAAMNKKITAQQQQKGEDMSHTDNFTNISGESDKDRNRLSHSWRKSIVAPSNAKDPDENVLPFRTSIALSSIHGIENNSPGKNLFYNSHCEVIYSTASTGIIYNNKTNQQSFFRGHASRISAMAISPSRRLIASGDTASLSKIILWDANTTTEICCLKGYHRSGVESLEFSHNGRYLLSLGTEFEHIICIWKSFSGQWYDGIIQCKFQCVGTSINFVAFSNHSDDSVDFVVGVDDRVQFWNYHCNTLSQQEGALGEYEESASNEIFLCGASLASSSATKFVTGAKSGNLYLFEGTILSSVVKAHDDSINSLCICRNGFITGGADGRIILWSSSLEITKRIDIAECTMSSNLMPSLDCSIQNIHANETLESNYMCSKLLVGTKGSEIYEVSVSTSSTSCLQEGHKIEVSGLCFHPCVKDIFATCGTDGIRFWNTTEKKMIKKLLLDNPISSICWSHDGNQLLAGCCIHDDNIKHDGSVYVIDYSNLRVLFEWKFTGCGITKVKYGPESKLIAISTTDNKVQIYQNSDENKYEMISTAEGNHASILSIDFSKDNYLIQTGSLNHQHLRFIIEYGEILSLPSQIKDVEWDTYTCRYGWHVSGIWPTNVEEMKLGLSEPTCVDRYISPSKNILAAGTSSGEVCLYPYPTTSKQMKNTAVYNASHRYSSCHTCEVASCAFSCDGSFLVTIGRYDKSIAVWKVISD